MTLSVVTTNNQTGTQTVTIRPVSVEIGQVFTLSLFGVEVSYEAVDDTNEDVVAGLLAAIEASSDPEWSLVESELNQAGDALLISYSVTAGVLKLWRGDAQAVAQVTRVVAPIVNIGNKFSLSINRKLITVTATAGTSANVAALFRAAIDANQNPEWREVDATVDGDYLVLTAATAGIPFTIDAATGSLILIENVASGVVPVSCVQSFTVPVNTTGGFSVVFGDKTASGIAIGASAATVQTALQALTTIGSGNVAVSRTDDGNDYTYTCTFQGALASLTTAQMMVFVTCDTPPIRTVQQGASSGTPQDEIQSIELHYLEGIRGAQEFTLTLDGQTTGTISGPDFAASARSQLVSLSGLGASLGANGVSVSMEDNLLLVRFIDVNRTADQSLMTSTMVSGEATVLKMDAEVLTSGVSPVNARQRITLGGSPTGGTFTVTFGGETTAAVAYNASAATLKTALLALSSIGTGNCDVTGSAGGPWIVEFTGSLAASPQTALTGDADGLTGGSADRLTVTTSIVSRGPNHWDDPDNWLPVGVPQDFDRVRFELGTSDCLWGLDQSELILTEIEINSSYTGSIGLPRQNTSGYLEYRCRDLTVHCPSILIGNGNGSGSGKIQLNTLTTTCYMEIRNTGGAREPGVPAVTWIGDNEATEIVLRNGDLGIAVWSDQVAVLKKIEQYGGMLRVDHATLEYLYAPGQSPRAHETRVQVIEL